MALIIKSLSVDPPNYDDLSDDEDDFVKDPAQYRDQLPQPYRYIDDLLGQFLDEVWEDITARENERVAEKSKIRPPRYECAAHLEELSNSKALVSSEDGRYLFAGFAGGIHLLNAPSKQLITSYEDERLDVRSITCTMIGVELYLLSTIDEQGVCRLFGCCAEKILLMKIVNDDASTINHHTIKSEMSLEGDYLGLLLENPTTSETALEVHSLPRDAWCKELEELKVKFIKEGEKDAPPSPTHQLVPESQEVIIEEKSDGLLIEPPGAADGSELADGNKSVESMKHERILCKGKITPLKPLVTYTNSNVKRFVTKKRKSSQRCLSRERSTISSGPIGDDCATRSSTATSGRSSRTNRRRKACSKKGAPLYKFSPSSLVMKQNPPPTLSPNTGPSPAATLAGFPDIRSVIGTGQNNALTKQYLEVRSEAFKQMHADRLIYKSAQSDDRYVDCTFHFLTPGLMIPYGIEQPGASKKPTTVGVWWSGHRLFSLYCMTRPVKSKKTDTGEGELYLKAESVWPQADIITASTTSPDSCLIAIGLRNGMVSIWDKQLSVMRKSVTVSETLISSINILDPTICPQFNNRQQCYNTSTSCYALVRASNSAVSLLNCGMLDIGPTIHLSKQADSDDDKLTKIFLFPSRIPEIILKVHKDGRMFLQDVITAEVLCEIALPSPYRLNTPWCPTLSISAYGQLLYVQGVTESLDDIGDEVKQTSLHVFQLRSFMTLDKYWSRARVHIPYTSVTPIDRRVNALLTHRIQISGRRKQRLQERWPLMKQELNRIVSLRAH